MDLIGGGAKDYHAFFGFLGEEKDLGSPFQINFPTTASPEMNPYNPAARNCSDNDLLSRCTCIDCPQICPVLEPVPTPGGGPSCHVGSLTCLSFVLILMYSLCAFAFFFGFSIQTVLRRKKEKKYDQVLSAETASDTPLSPRIRTHGLVGASSLARYVDGEQSSGNTDSRSLGRGVQLLDPIETVQPRQYRLNSVLRSFFYRLGQVAASSPWLVMAVMFTIVGLLNIGWKNFSVETDPVRLWVAPNSESKLQKEYFDEHFGPFYRTEQIFATATPIATYNANSSAVKTTMESKPPVLSWEHLKFWFKVNAEIRSLTSSPHGYQLDDVCFKPAGSGGSCVVQSVTAWFGDDIDNTSADDWAARIEKCANTPVECLPDFQQPLGPKYVLGGIPDTEHKYLDAEALVMTIVVSDSLDTEVQEKAMEWERNLREYLVRLSENAPEDIGLAISFSTGVSLEEELNKSTNTDVKIVVLSYLAMFVYISLTLGNGFATQEEEGVISSLHNWAVNFPKFFTRSHVTSSTLSIDSRNNPRFFPRLPRKLFVGSKFTLGLFGISLVILSVSTSIGFFSAIGVKVTLIIAEVIPFLVLAVGVDNVFILVHELDRQNMLHGPNAAPPEQPLNYASATSPTSRRSQFESHDDSVDAQSVPLYLSPEERVARTLARMGPSILLSTITETFAFALGALVPMPAVRNFALYAAGSVLLNAILQVTVFVSALLLDLRRVEVSHQILLLSLLRPLTSPWCSRTGWIASHASGYLLGYNFSRPRRLLLALVPSLGSSANITLLSC